jgi:hypothetical protein
MRFLRPGLLGVAALVSAVSCVKEPKPLSVCEEVDLKRDLCELPEAACETDAGSCDCDDQQLDERKLCELRCVLDATCEDFELNFPLGIGRVAGSAKIRECFADCRSTSGGDDFTCDDGTVITADWVCDGIDDCDDGSDELGCSS